MIVAAIESVFAQTCPVLDVIVVDDGSVDGTADVIRNLIRRTSSGSGRRPKIRYIGQPNMGQSHARNTGIAAARGDWIAFLILMTVGFPTKFNGNFAPSHSSKASVACVFPTLVW